jgi:hypothetical protein
MVADHPEKKPRALSPGRFIERLLRRKNEKSMLGFMGCHIFNRMCREYGVRESGKDHPGNDPG